jgi:hypothetical protein
MAQVEAQHEAGAGVEGLGGELAAVGGEDGVDDGRAQAAAGAGRRRCGGGGGARTNRGERNGWFGDPWT